MYVCMYLCMYVCMYYACCVYEYLSVPLAEMYLAINREEKGLKIEEFH